MTPTEKELEDFERRTRVLLEESVSRIDGRIRSRLNRARHAALAAAEEKRHTHWWRSFGLAPAAGVVAAVLLAVVLWAPRPAQMLPVAESGSNAVEDLDLVADGETFDLIQQGDGGFYEWAVAQADAEPEATG
jgi:hypothetical protein